MTEISMLENPIWHALDTEQKGFCRGGNLAACYDPDVSRFAGLAVPSPEAFDQLASILAPDERVAFFTAAPLEVPRGWQVLRARPLEQMVCERLLIDDPGLELQLGTDDVPDMLALAAATEPGPFFPGTIRMGRYFGVRSEDGRLAAMAGERIRMTCHTEISAVCTDPAFRGRGLAKTLVAGLTAKILSEGSLPFLHVKTENGAKGLYETLGFAVSRTVHLTVTARQQSQVV